MILQWNKDALLDSPDDGEAMRMLSEYLGGIFNADYDTDATNHGSGHRVMTRIHVSSNDLFNFVSFFLHPFGRVNPFRH